jgi:hypothetical protein
METANYAPHGMAPGFSRMLLVLAIAMMAGAMLAQHVDAKRMPANGASIASRVQAQKDLCDIGGGTFESSKTAFGSTITTCTGGDGGAGTCVNTTQSTNCHPPLTQSTEDVVIPPTGGVFEEPPGPLPGSVEAGSTGVKGRKATISDDSHDRDGDRHHGKGHGKGKGKRKGGRGGR